MYKLAILGSPIAHSLSPQIHQAFAKQFNIPLRYERIETPLELFHQTITQLQKDHYLGINVTLPLKVLAYQCATTRSTEAQYAQAVNTIHFSQNAIAGHNTDGEGFIYDLTDNHNVQLAGQSILVCGAGGSARGILPLITKHHPKKIYLYNRTTQRAKDLIHDLNLSNCEIIDNAEELAATKITCLINTMAQSGFYEQFKHISINLAHVFCYDLNYGRFHDSFKAIMRAKNCDTHTDGLGMLVGQAAKAFNYWFKKMPDTQAILMQLKQLT